MSNRERYRIRSVHRALTILEMFADCEPEMSLVEISRRIEIPVSTTYRLLVTLEAESFIVQSSQTGKYRLGPTILGLANAFLRHSDLRKFAMPFLQDLRDKTGETIHLAILDKREIVYLEKLAGLHPIGLMSSRIGGHAPIYCTGVGKAILAYIDNSEILSELKNAELVQFTENTITEWDRLLDELAIVRKNGYALDKEEHEAGVACVSSPIFDHEGVLASVSVAGPSNRIISELKKSDLAKAVKKTADEISVQLGGSEFLA